MESSQQDCIWLAQKQHCFYKFVSFLNSEPKFSRVDFCLFLYSLCSAFFLPFELFSKIPVQLGFSKQSRSFMYPLLPPSAPPNCAASFVSELALTSAHICHAAADETESSWWLQKNGRCVAKVPLATLLTEKSKEGIKGKEREKNLH